MPQRVFISYARRDGADLAQRLEADLRRSGFYPWLDRNRLTAGERWTDQIQSALENADIVLALLSDASFISDVCRIEQHTALDLSKRTIPVLVQRDCKVPLLLTEFQRLDFSDPDQYDTNLQALILALEPSPKSPPPPPPTYNNAPPRPENFVDRPELLARLRDELFHESKRRNLAITALHGMGGIGKTVLAQALCRDPAVERAFPDGIFWITIGREPRAFSERIESVPGLKKIVGDYTGEQACESQFRNALRDKAALVVLDDVWNAADIEPFRAESPRSRLLITTRDAGIAPNFGARPFTAELLSEAESREVLSVWSGIPLDQLPPQAEDVIGECKDLPLALAMIGAQLNGKPLAHWDVLLGHLRRAELAKIKSRFPEPHTSLFRAIDVSVEALRRDDPVAADRYLALAVILEDMSVPAQIQRTLWNVDDVGALETAECFVSLSLAQRDGADGAIRLHDLQLDYLRAHYPDRVALDLILDAVRLSAHVIDKDPHQFASQVIGRLLAHREVAPISHWIETATAGALPPWLRLMHAALHPPGTELIRTLEGHSSDVIGVAVTADGRRALSASNDGTLILWDLKTGRALRTLEGHLRGVNGVAVTADGLRAVSASEDRMMILWDLETGRALRTLEGHSESVNGVAVTPDGRAVSASSDDTLKVWDLKTGRAVRTLEGHSDSVRGVAVTPDGRRAVSASEDRMMILWDLETGRALRTLEGHSDSVRGVAVSLDGRLVVSTSRDKTLKVWDLETDGALRTLEGHSGSVEGVAVTADGRRAVSASLDNTLRVWDLDIGRARRTLEGHFNYVRGVAVTPDGRLAVSASSDNALKVWNLETGRARRTLEGHFNYVWGVAATPDGRLAVSASSDNTLKVWNLETGRALRTLEGHFNYVWGVAVTPDGRLAVSASRDNTLKVWDLETGRALRTLRGHSSSVHGVAVTPDGRRAVSASWDNTLKVWDLETGHALRTLEGHFDYVWGVAVTPDGRLAVSASRDNTLKVWDLETGRASRTLEGHSNYVCGVAVTPDGRLAVSASRDNTLKVWDLETGRALRTLRGHSSSVHGVAVTPDERRAVSASDDKTLILWDLETGIAIATFHSDSFAQCCACAGNRTIIAGDSAGRVYFLRLEE